MRTRDTVSRRRFLRAAVGAAGVGLAAAACAPIAPAAPTAAPAGQAAPPATSKPIAPSAAGAASPAAGPSPAAPAAAKPAPQAAQGAIKRGGTLTFMRTAELQSFNPAELNPGSYPMLRALYNSLVRYDQNINPNPDLAERFELASDGQSIRLELRRGVKFHSGREVTAEDVRFSVDWFKDAKNGSPIRGAALEVVRLETPDPYTVVLGFDQPNPGVYDMLDLLFILDQSVVDRIAQTDAGTGPFRVAEYRPNDQTRFVPFADYWDRGKPYIDDFILKPSSDSQSMALQLEAGAVDVMWNPAYPDLVRFGRDPRFVTSAGAPGASIFDIAVNTSRPDLNDKRVRQAISYAVDRERFTRTVLQGLVEPSSLPVPKTSWAYFPDLEGRHARDIDKAKQLMAQAGKAAGFDVVLLTSGKRAAGYTELAQILQSDLAQIGIRAPDRGRRGGGLRAAPPCLGVRPGHPQLRAGEQGPRARCSPGRSPGTRKELDQVRIAGVRGDDQGSRPPGRPRAAPSGLPPNHGIRPRRVLHDPDLRAAPCVGGASPGP